MTTTAVSAIPTTVANLVGTRCPLSTVLSIVSQVAACAGDGDAAAARAYLEESGGWSHGWAGAEVATPTAMAAAAASPTAWTTWREAILAEDWEMAKTHPNGWGLGILPTSAGGPMASMTASGRTVWGILPTGKVLRVVTRNAGGVDAHVVSATVGAEDVIAIVAATRRPPADEAEALAVWSAVDVGVNGPTVIATQAAGRWAFRPGGVRDAAATAEPRHVGADVVAKAVAWSATWNIKRQAQARRAAEERLLEEILGRPMPRA